MTEYEKLTHDKCRPFNRITMDGHVLMKEPADHQGEQLAAYERAWYKKTQILNMNILPGIFETKPLKMEYIKGKNIYEYKFVNEEKKNVLQKLIRELMSLHASESINSDYFSVKEAYFRKTVDRLSEIRELVPYANRKTILINGKNAEMFFLYA